MKPEHQHDLTYLTQCPEVNCNKNYLEETARRLREKVLDHAGKDRKLNMVKHSIDTGCPPVCRKDIQILTKGLSIQEKNMQSIAHKKTSTNTK